MVKANTIYLLFIKSATSLPETIAGGTPGPGTDNCPVKYMFLTNLLFNLGLRNEVWRSVFANP